MLVLKCDSANGLFALQAKSRGQNVPCAPQILMDSYNGSVGLATSVLDSTGIL